MLQKKCNRTQAHYKSGMVPAITHRGVCIRATQTCCGYPAIPESQPEQGWGRPSRTCHTHTAPALGSGSPLRLLLALRHLSFIPGIKAEAPSTGRDTALVTVTILLSKSMKQGHQTPARVQQCPGCAHSSSAPGGFDTAPAASTDASAQERCDSCPHLQQQVRNEAGNGCRLKPQGEFHCFPPA